MVTRRINNTGAPLNNPKGQALINTSISFVIVDATGKRVDVFDSETGERISGLVKTTTDNNGEFIIDLFPTTRADKLCYYLVHVHNNAFLDFRAALQEGSTPISWFAFKHGGVEITPYEFSLIQYYLDNFIDDATTSDSKTWSSNKISDELGLKANADHVHDTEHSHDNKSVIDLLSDEGGELLYNGSSITNSEIIDDTVARDDKTFSSNKIVEITQYVHDQVVPASVWTVNHPMKKYPSVTVVDSAGDLVNGDVQYVSDSQIILSFEPGSFAGKVYLS